MKIQCSCGAKYNFDVTPEMAQKPVRFVCAKCGLDSSEFVNGLIRQELAGTEPAEVPPTETAPDLPPAPPPTGRLQLHKTVAPAAPEPSSSDDEENETCVKHPGQPITARCRVCQAPLCPQCMELFGYVCSPLCKAWADSRGLNIPVFAGQKSVVEAKRWRKLGILSGVVGAVVLAALGFWFWYAWFGSVPKPVFSVRFPDKAYSGQSEMCGGDQIVFLHGGTLARCDLKTKQQIWSCELVDPKRVQQIVGHQIRAFQAMIDKANADGREEVPKMPSGEKLTADVSRELAAALRLHVAGRNIWVASGEKLARYDWDTGKVAQEIPLAAGHTLARGDELVIASVEGSSVTHVDLLNGQTRVEEIGKPVQLADSKKTAGSSTGDNAATAGLPSASVGTDAAKPMDPAKVAEQAQHLPYAAQIALPATLAASANQERTMAEMNDRPTRSKTAPPLLEPVESFDLIPGKSGFARFSVRLLESRVITRSAMKAPPKKSALDNLSGANSGAAANEILNEMQRSRGGDKVSEDESRYQVTVRQADANGAADWTGEVVGPPGLAVLQTVNVVTAGKSVVVLDKNNKQLWQAALTYIVSAGSSENGAAFGEGPCVEHGGTLFVFDQAVLTAFDLATGNARWRLPSVGVVGVFFDDQGMMYVNTTTASPDSVRYSRQIDITEKTHAVILKLDPKNGKILWTAEPGGFISHLAGKFIYTVQSFDPGDEDDNPYKVDTGLETPPYLRIRRINPANGRLMWEHYEQRAPLDVRFDANTIRVVLKKEVEVLRFLSL